MHFSKLRMTGFKSFVDATELWIEPGLTGVVGPNGCGKSNLVEALRWVMGETSAKQMRGSGMEDVIFGGTDTRPARNLAEVGLYLDNADRSAPAMFNDSDEIDVTRRIERDAGSVYRVNGAETRARDVQTLFADLASGARSTALVSQGRIGAIISAKPTDRRHLLEEAAGITGLHSRRHEAELRLKAAETNLERLDDVLAALEDQLKGLKRQARQASRYRNLSDHIHRAEAIFFHLQWKRATAERETAAQDLAEAEELVAEMTRTAAHAATLQTDAAADMPGLREAESASSAALQRLIVARDALDEEEQRIEQARRDIGVRLEQISGDVGRETALKADAEEAAERLDQEAAAICDAQGNEEADLNAAKEALAQAAASVARFEAELTGITEKVATDEAREAALHRQAAELELRRSRVAERRETIRSECAEAEAEIAAEGLIDDVRQKSTAMRGVLDQARQAVEVAEQVRSAGHDSEAEAREAMQKSESVSARLGAEYEALAQLLTVGDPDQWPPIIDALDVQPGYEIALAAALGDDLNAPGDEAAPMHWRTLPPLDGAPALPAGAEALNTVIDGPAALGRRLAQVGVVEDDETGARLADQLAHGQRLVSKSGALWRWDGYTAVRDAAEAAARRIAQRSRLKDLRAECDTAEDALRKTRERFTDAKATVLAADDSEHAARDAVRRAEDTWHEARDAEAEMAQKSARARSRLESLQATAETLSADDAEIDKQATASADELTRFADIEDERRKAGALRAELTSARGKESECQGAHDRLIRDAATGRERLSDIAAEIESWRRRAATSEQQLVQLAERRENAAEELKRLEARPAEIATQRSALFEQIAKAEENRNQAADALAKAETRLDELGRDLRAKEAQLAERREERVRSESQVTQIDQVLAGITERVRERLDSTPEQALEQADVKDDDKLPDQAAIEVRVERLKRERENMGPVNLRADMESKELLERIETMQDEREDLLSAIARLRQGIAGLNREGRTRLLAAFKEVDTHFRDLFARLFGGGRAHLSLTEAEDPLDAGLEIMASPPGKKLQTMSLLSGGEQALTALALLFAVFMTNPAPICVLDEVDAPLDDANVDRFCRLLTDIAEQSQTRFLIVTHHRLTMARMDRLFGVTMSERGVSQLVSVDLRAAEELRDSA